MSPSNFIVWLIVLTLSFFLIVFAIDKPMPYQKRAEFISICDNYNQIAIRRGYLKAEDINEMTAALAVKGINISVLNVPQSKLEWGTKFTFKADAIYSQGELQVDYNKNVKTYYFSYEKSSATLCEE